MGLDSQRSGPGDASNGEVPFRIPLSPAETGLGERELLLTAFDSLGEGTEGYDVQGFEYDVVDYLGADVHAIAVSSGTAALHLALLAVGMRTGDDVLCPTLTAPATVHAIEQAGGTPVFVDAEPTTWNVDPELVVTELHAAAARNNLPAAVVTVDLYGQCADHDPIVEAAHHYNVPVIEDAAEALGATHRGRPAGTLGDVGIFSFGSEQIVTTSSGGMLVTPDPELARRARQLLTPTDEQEDQPAGARTYDYALSPLLAAVGRGQLRDLDARVARRREIHRLYRDELRGLPVTFQGEATGGDGTRWLTCLTLDTADHKDDATRVRTSLTANGIEARPLWGAAHLQAAFQGYRAIGGNVAQSLSERGLCLPSGGPLAASEIHEVAALITEAAG